MSEYLITWEDFGEKHSESVVAGVMDERLQELAVRGVRDLRLYKRVPLEIKTSVRIVKRIRKDSLTAGSSVGSPPRTSAGLVVSDVRPQEQLFREGESHPTKEPRADGQRVAGEEGLRHAMQHPEAPGETQDREAGADRLAGSGSGNGEPPTVPAAAIPDDAYARRIFRMRGPVGEGLNGETCFYGTVESAKADAERWRASEPALANVVLVYLYAEEGIHGKESPDQAVKLEAGPLDLPKGETAADNEKSASKESPLIVGAAVQPPLPHFLGKCEAPDCGNPGEEDRKSGGRFCCALHLGLDLSIRREFHFAKHPELKKSRRKKIEAANGV